MDKPLTDTAQRIHQAVEYVRRTVDVDLEHEPGHITSLYDLFDAFPVTIREVEALTYRRAAQFVASQTGHDAIPVPANEHQPLAGLLYAYKHHDVCRACILVHQDDPVERRRFTAAHELGHYIMHFLLLIIGVSTDSIHIPVLLEGCDMKSSQ